MIWKVPVSSNIRAILTNPVYAGAYAFGHVRAKALVIASRSANGFADRFMAFLLGRGL
jgi:hypothetical protein